jgi:ssDNA-binding Zn-finger/Zn-ribbon topoisomerase 1
MPYDDFGHYVESKADNTSDIIGFGDVGGIGQLIYHTFRFKDYEFEYDTNDVEYLKPIVYKGMEPDIDKQNGLSGKELFQELYNLGRRINSFSEKKPFTELIAEFCKNIAHPYDIDSLYSTLSEVDITAGENGYWVERDGMFGVSGFIHDLGRLYVAAQFYFALKDECSGNSDQAFNMATEGKFFEGLPFFERYKREEPEKQESVPETDTLGDIVEIMKAYAKLRKKPDIEEPPTSFAREPFDYYEELRDILIDIIPDFHMRLKLNPKNNSVVFAADVHSVFDIAWYTLARMIVDFGPPEEAGQRKDKYEGTLTTCPICGTAFIRRNNRHTYCGDPQCKKTYNAQRAKKSRRNKKLLATQEKSKK